MALDRGDRCRASLLSEPMGDVAQDIKAFKKARPSRRQGLQEGKAFKKGRRACPTKTEPSRRRSQGRRLAS
jgi:hypothetical protein